MSFNSIVAGCRNLNLTCIRQCTNVSKNSMPFHLCLCTEILCRLCRGIGCTWNIPALMIFSSALADKLGVHFNL
ncbi:hypothetical protein BDL97_18G006800 [Sphagnum fallax]|nr:hypothetical protein BDL97_18G006800 [Sphagnum fallax]